MAEKVSENLSGGAENDEGNPVSEQLKKMAEEIDRKYDVKRKKVNERQATKQEEGEVMDTLRQVSKELLVSKESLKARKKVLEDELYFELRKDELHDSTLEAIRKRITEDLKNRGLTPDELDLEIRREIKYEFKSSKRAKRLGEELKIVNEKLAKLEDEEMSAHEKYPVSEPDEPLILHPVEGKDDNKEAQTAQERADVMLLLAESLTVQELLNLIPKVFREIEDKKVVQQTREKLQQLLKKKAKEEMEVKSASKPKKKKAVEPVEEGESVSYVDKLAKLNFENLPNNFQEMLIDSGAIPIDLSSPSQADTYNNSSVNEKAEMLKEALEYDKKSRKAASSKKSKDAADSTEKPEIEDELDGAEPEISEPEPEITEDESEDSGNTEKALAEAENDTEKTVILINRADEIFARLRELHEETGEGVDAELNTLHRELHDIEENLETFYDKGIGDRADIHEVIKSIDIARKIWEKKATSQEPSLKERLKAVHADQKGLEQQAEASASAKADDKVGNPIGKTLGVTIDTLWASTKAFGAYIKALFTGRNPKQAVEESFKNSRERNKAA